MLFSHPPCMPTLLFAKELSEKGGYPLIRAFERLERLKEIESWIYTPYLAQGVPENVRALLPTSPQDGKLYAGIEVKVADAEAFENSAGQFAERFSLRFCIIED